MRKALLLLALMTGCGSTVNLLDMGSRGARGLRPMGGLVNDVRVVANESPGPWLLFMPPEIALSTGLDVVTLPITIPVTLARLAPATTP